MHFAAAHFNSIKVGKRTRGEGGREGGAKHNPIHYTWISPFMLLFLFLVPEYSYQDNVIPSLCAFSNNSTSIPCSPWPFSAWRDESKWATVSPARPDPTTATRSFRGGPGTGVVGGVVVEGAVWVSLGGEG